MGKEHGFLERFLEEAELAEQGLPGESVVELGGDTRVLIENHYGVKEYSREKIVVKVKYGCVCVCGCNLALLRMTREQLVIRGRIDGITLMRRSKR